ncbi:SGNH hydrolase-type esterase domain-containing protein [Mycena galopus ATCC 62051]|nr:SGNH hydrolase-type esterase domain-containing protein [Mycena galopus ATCC 62051]
MLVQLWDEDIKESHVEIVLIDWASVLEIEGFVCADPATIVSPASLPKDQILFIGDSITCGLALDESDGGQPMPRGILDAFPHRAISLLREKLLHPLSFEMVAYPGISLVSLDPPQQDSTLRTGMVDRLLHISPWDTAAWTPRGNPTFICIALGTNDEANDVSPALFRRTLQEFVRTLSITFPSVKAFYVPPFRDFSEADAGEIYSDLVSHPVTVDDLLIEVCTGINSGMTSEHTVDGLHPTLAGHDILAGNLAQFLVPQLGQRLVMR